MATLTTEWGGKDSNSFVAYTEADSYLGSMKLDLTYWTSATTVQRETALLIASRQVDDACHWSGERVYVDQALNFPRVPSGDERWPWVQRTLGGGVTSVNTWDIYLTEQRRRVKQAVCEQAFSLLRDGERNEHLERQAVGIRGFSEGIGPLSESASYGGTSLSLVPEALKLLMPYRGYPELVRG